MKVTREFLEKEGACLEGVKWYVRHELTDHAEIINTLVADNHFDWANWLIVRLMKKKQKVQYAVFAADQVIGIYDKKHPDDNRPRLAIEAAKKYLEKPSIKNKNAAASAAVSAAAYAAYAAYAAAYAAVSAAYAAAYAADSAAYAAYAAYAAAYAADSAAASAAYAAYAAASAAYAAAYAAASAAKLKQVIINYGLSLLEITP
jgi:hypothetical protein